MNFLNSWLQGIMIAVIVSTIIEMILPNGSNKKYIKVVLGIYVVFNIITPVINQFVNSDFALSSILNIEEYTKKMETYEVDNRNINIDETNENNIKQIYEVNLKNDIEAKLKEKGYQVEQINVEIANDETYQIKTILLSLEKIVEKQETSNTIAINEIEKVEIQIGENKQEKQSEQKNQITEKEKKEIKQYLASIYETNEKDITIY